MAKIGYARCSTADQNPARQEQILKEAGCQRIYVDMLSGKDMNRPELKKMMEYLRKDDVLYVESISRLSRSTKDFLEILDELKEKGVHFISQKEQFDTNTPQGKFVLTMYAAMAELERNQNRQRQAEGIAIAKKNGKYKGRTAKKFDHHLFSILYKSWKNGEITQAYMCAQLNMSKRTLYKYIKQYEYNSKQRKKNKS